MIGPQDVRFNFIALAGSNEARLIGVKERKTYDKTTNKRTDTVEGINYEVLLERRGFNKVTIKTNDIMGVVDDETVKNSEEPIYVSFSDDLEARFYYKDGNFFLTVKSETAKLVSSSSKKEK